MASDHGPIKICFVIGTLDRGGTEGQLVELVTRLDRSRFDPWVCCLAEGGPHQARLEAAGVPVESLGLRRSGRLRLPVGAVPRLARLVSLMRARRPQIVHGFLFWGYVLGAAAARVNRVPVVVASRRSLGLFKASRPHWLLLERLTNAYTDHVVANSQAVRLDTIRRERLDERDVSVVYNGIDIRAFECAAATATPALASAVGIAGCRPVIAVVANLIDYKGHRYFLEALRRVLAEYPAAVALLIGEGPERSTLEAQATADGISHSIRWLGARADVPQLLAMVDVVVHPSTQEGFSNAIVEAMAAGKPIVATAVGGTLESVVDGETGLIVPPRDSGGLANAMLSLFRDPARRAAMGSAARARARNRFSVDRMVREYSQLYDSLLARHDRPAGGGHRGSDRAVASGRGM